MTATATNPYRLRKPCGNCPFRTDVKPYLRTDRAREIATALQDGATFPCHKTTVDAEDGDGNEIRVEGPRSQECAGALAVMERQGFAGQVTRVAERLGLYNPERLDADAPVYRSLDAFVEAYREANGDPEPLPHCGIGGPDCQDPAGWMTTGGVTINVEPGTAEVACSFCGQDMCPDCRAEDQDGWPVCVECAEDSNDQDDEDDEEEDR